LIYIGFMRLIKLMYISQAKSITVIKHSDNILLTEKVLAQDENFSSENVFSTLLISIDKYANQSLNQKLTVNFVFTNGGFHQLQKER